MQKKTLLNIAVYSIFIFLLSSCVSQKQVAYFQKGPNQSDTIEVAKAYIPKIQPGDILSINIGSLSSAASSFFNPYAATPVNADAADLASGGSTSSQAVSPGYLVDQNGIIEMPLLGKVKLLGLTTVEAREIIKGLVQKYLKEPVVNVRFLNYKISIMGEVNKPAVYVIPNERISLPEAISLAGDLTIYGKRDNILIIRDQNGKKEFGRINLNTRDLYNSPYYYLHNNDVIYVEPGKAKVNQTNGALTILPLAISAISLIFLIVSRY